MANDNAAKFDEEPVPVCERPAASRASRDSR
jgi:hypothetical protein